MVMELVNNISKYGNTARFDYRQEGKLWRIAGLIERENAMLLIEDIVPPDVTSLAFSQMYSI